MATFKFTAGTTGNGDDYVEVVTAGKSYDVQPSPDNDVSLQISGDGLSGRFTLTTANAKWNFRRADVLEDGSITAGDLTDDDSLKSKLRELFFSEGSGGGGGNVAAGTVEDSIYRWNDVTQQLEEDPETTLEDVTTNLVSVSAFAKNIYRKFAGVATAFVGAFQLRLNSGGLPNPAGTLLQVAETMSIASETTTANATASVILDTATQRPEFFARFVTSAGDASSFRASPASGVQSIGLGYQPSYNFHTADDDSFNVTTAMQTVVISTVGVTPKDCTVTLPATPLTYQTVTIINNGDGVVNITGNGNEIMFAGYEHYLSTNNSAATLQFDGTVWRLVGGVGLTAYSAKRIDGKILNSKTAGFTPAACYITNVIVNSSISGSGSHAYIRILLGGNEVVAPFQLAGGLEIVNLNAGTVGGLEMSVQVVTQSTYDTETIDATFDIVPR